MLPKVQSGESQRPAAECVYLLFVFVCHGEAKHKL